MKLGKLEERKNYLQRLIKEKVKLNGVYIEKISSLGIKDDDSFAEKLENGELDDDFVELLRVHNILQTEIVNMHTFFLNLEELFSEEDDVNFDFTDISSFLLFKKTYKAFDDYFVIKGEELEVKEEEKHVANFSNFKEQLISLSKKNIV